MTDRGRGRKRKYRRFLNALGLVYESTAPIGGAKAIESVWERI